ncbi:MAG: carboxypeptidase-like regulatory domain-containing protein, partial [Bacteroidales bacterium]|nr:carboxypeptidase-like regulatory domain-containing protein [Bacteroidales bacterium]
MKEKRLLSLLLTVMLSIVAFAQNQTFTGTVVDANGEPVIGATVVQKGTSNTVATDFDGNFSITCPSGAELEITYVGFGKQTVLAGNNMHITITEDAETLNEVVVIGYGVQKKSVVTASIAKVSSEDLDGKTRLRAEDALKGMAAGVNVVSSSGQPGAQSLICIRGIGSINNSNPLFII